MTKKKYRQLQPEERVRIEIWKAENIGVRDMAFRLGRSLSTISRELAVREHGIRWARGHGK